MQPEPTAAAENYDILVGLDGTDFDPYEVSDPEITLDQVLKLVKAKPASEFDVYAYGDGGKVYRMRECEQIDLRQTGAEKFIVFRTDRANRILIDEDRFDWGAKTISGQAIREISGNDNEELELWIERKGVADEKVENDRLINVEEDGVERFYFLKKVWQLKVRRDTLEFDKPCVLASEVLEKAGFDLEKCWDMVLVTASGRINVGINDKIDLSEPGVEKLRIKPKTINNGEQAKSVNTAFSLLPKDHDYLNATHSEWRTIIDGGKRWLIIDNYRLPQGYDVEYVSMALDVPASYPAEQIDMFYVSPALRVLSGKPIPQVSVTQAIGGLSYQRWSRHRPKPDDWMPEVDCIETHLELVEESLLREVQ
jgi:hypothetical protein